jgi:hypothetical protein
VQLNDDDDVKIEISFFFVLMVKNKTIFKLIK